MARGLRGDNNRICPSCLKSPAHAQRQIHGISAQHRRAYETQVTSALGIAYRGSSVRLVSPDLCPTRRFYAATVRCALKNRLIAPRRARTSSSVALPRLLDAGQHSTSPPAAPCEPMNSNDISLPSLLLNHAGSPSLFSRMASSTRQPRKNGPSPRQYPRRFASSQPASTRASDRMGMRSQACSP